MVKNGNFTLLLTSSGQEWQFHIPTDIKWTRMAISHCYWHLVIKNGNFSLLLTSSASRMAISHSYWHLLLKKNGIFHIPTDIVVDKNGNFTLLLTSSHHEWQFHIATDIYWSRLAIPRHYWLLVVMNDNLTSLLTSTGLEWQFHIATEI